MVVAEEGYKSCRLSQLLVLVVLLGVGGKLTPYAHGKSQIRHGGDTAGLNQL